MDSSSWYVVASVVFIYVAAIASVPSVLLQRRGRPAAALSWLFALFALPAIGVIGWWFFGRLRFDQRMRRLIRSEESMKQMKGPRPFESGTSFDEQMSIEAIGKSVFPSGSNQIKILIDGPEAFETMEKAIQSARKTIVVQFYIWKRDKTGTHFRDLLVAKAKEGVDVRVLADAHGSRTFRGRFTAPLKEAGAEVRRFSPRLTFGWTRTLNFINHRKVIIIDGKLAFTGGMNVGDEYRHKWRDLMIQINGGAVAALSRIFQEDWHFSGGSRVADIALPKSSGTVECAIVSGGPIDEISWIHQAYFQTFVNARKRLWIATPYFIPSQSLNMALQVAARTGVDVRILLPINSDVRLVRWASRSYYPGLLQAGVKIFEYRGPMLHAKALIVDESFCSIGTANVDTRSFGLSFEVSCFMISEELTQQLSNWYESLLSDSDKVEIPEHEPFFRALFDSAIHLASPLL